MAQDRRQPRHAPDDRLRTLPRPSLQGAYPVPLHLSKGLMQFPALSPRGLSSSPPSLRGAYAVPLPLSKGLTQFPSISPRGLSSPPPSLQGAYAIPRPLSKGLMQFPAPQGSALLEWGFSQVIITVPKGLRIESATPFRGACTVSIFHCPHSVITSSAVRTISSQFSQ